MCVVSMVHDHYEPKIPDMGEYTWPQKVWVTQLPAPNASATPVIDLKEFAKLIAEFRQLVEAAKLIDAKTGQPDCVDPEKVKLEDRIRDLEKVIASPPEFVIVSGGNLEPGRYRVIDGKLYKAVG